MNEESRIRILNMLKDGTITVEEAERLLSAVGEKEAAAGTETVSLKDSRGRKGKKFRIVVDTEDERKKSARVNVSIPVSIVKTLGPIAAKYLPKEAAEELEEKGIDLGAIIGSIETLIESGSEEDIVNVDAGDSKVRIYVE